MSGEAPHPSQGRQPPLPPAGSPPWLRPADLLLPFLLFAAALALYLRCLAPGVLPGDAGELQFAPYLLGLPHPTGYPLYSLLGWAWSHLLPFGTVAYRMNLFSAFFSALAVALLYPAARALLRGPLPGLSPLVERLTALLAAALLAVTPTFWSQALIAEVYGLNTFLFVLLFYLLLSWGERRAAGGESPGPSARLSTGALLLLAALTFGLGLAHHRTTLLLIPAILAYLLSVDRRILRRGRLLLRALPLLLAPLLLYLYIPWRAPATPYLHLALAPGRTLHLYGGTPAAFLAFVLGGAYGGSLDLGVDLGARLAMAGRFLRADLGYALLALALLGLVALLARRRWSLLALTGLSTLALAGFNLFYTIGDIVVLFIPVFLLATLWAVVGVASLCHLAARLLRSARPPARALPGALAAAALALPLLLGAARFDALDLSRATQVEAGWRALLAEPFPQGALLVTDNRDEIMPMWYFQYVGDGARLRPDLLGLFPLITPDHPTLGHVLDLALSTGRPVYLIKEMPGVELKVGVQPEGALWRVVGPAAAAEPAHPLDASLGGLVRLAGYDLSPGELRPGESLSVELQWEALAPLDAPYHTYVHLFAPDGSRVAQSDHQPGGVYYPAPLWRVGERLLDQHLLALPPGALPGRYRLAAGMYRLNPDGTFTSLGDPVTLGDVQVR